MLPKIRITSKKLQIKVVRNRISHKKVRERICLSPPLCGARGLEGLIRLQYYIVLKRQITFNLGLNTAKNTHHMKKSFK